MDDTTDTLIDGDALARSITGFDQLAVRTRFRSTIADLAADDMMFARALLFISLMHGGAKEVDAYQNAMLVSAEGLQARFKGREVTEELDSDAVTERDNEFAEFVAGTGLSYTVAEFMELTLQQRAAVIEALNKRRG